MPESAVTEPCVSPPRMRDVPPSSLPRAAVGVVAEGLERMPEPGFPADGLFSEIRVEVAIQGSDGWVSTGSVDLIGPGGEALVQAHTAGAGSSQLEAESRSLLDGLRALDQASDGGVLAAVRAVSPSTLLVGQIRANLCSWIRAGHMDPENEESTVKPEARRMWLELHALIQKLRVVLRWEAPG